MTEEELLQKCRQYNASKRAGRGKSKLSLKEEQELLEVIKIEVEAIKPRTKEEAEKYERVLERFRQVFNIDVDT